MNGSEESAVRVVQFLENLRQRNYSLSTIGSQGYYLREFTGWLEERGITAFNDVTRPMLERYRGFVSRIEVAGGRPLHIKTQYLRLMAIRIFFRWLLRNDYIESNPAADFEMPKLGQSLPKNVLSSDEAETILNRVNLRQPLGVRDRAILELLYSSGLRRSELAKLKVDSIDINRGTIHVREGKGLKDRMLPLGERAGHWLEKYLLEVRPQLEITGDEGFLFLGRDGSALGRSYLTQLVGSYVAASGVSKGGSCHIFRHTMATLMLEGGADIRYVQEMLGHARIESTQIYTRVAIGKLKDVHAKTHPGALLKRPQGQDDEGAPPGDALNGDYKRDTAGRKT